MAINIASALAIMGPYLSMMINAQILYPVLQTIKQLSPALSEDFFKKFEEKADEHNTVSLDEATRIAIESFGNFERFLH